MSQRWQEWVIVVSVVVLAVVGFVTVFGDEIERWRGVDQAQRLPSEPTSAPPVAGNTQSTL